MNMKRLLILCAGFFLLSAAIASAQKVVVSSKGYTEKSSWRYAPAVEVAAAFGGESLFGAELYPLALRHGLNHWAGIGIGYALERDGYWDNVYGEDVITHYETYAIYPMTLSYQYNHFFSELSSVSAFVNASAGTLDILNMDEYLMASFRVGASFDASHSRHSIGIGLQALKEEGILFSLAYSVSFGL